MMPRELVEYKLEKENSTKMWKMVHKEKELEKNRKKNRTVIVH